MADRTFYSRKEQLAEMERMLGLNRWFFAKGRDGAESARRP